MQPPRRRRSGWAWWTLLLLVVVAVGLWFAWSQGLLAPYLQPYIDQLNLPVLAQPSTT